MSYVDPIYDIQIKFAAVQSGKVVSFRAAITEFSDTYSSNWDPQTAYGRMDPIFAFSNTERSISLGWQLAAKNSKEAQKHLRQVSMLIRMLYPAYDPVVGNTLAISGPPLVVVKFSNLIRNSGPGGTSALPDGLVCTIGDVSHNPDLENGFFIENGNLFPKVMALSCQLKPIHTHELGWVKGGKGGFDKIPFPYGQASVSIDSHEQDVPNPQGGPTENTDTPGTDPAEPDVLTAQKQAVALQEASGGIPGEGTPGVPGSAPSSAQPDALGGSPAAPMSNKELDEEAAKTVPPEAIDAEEQYNKTQALKQQLPVTDPTAAGQGSSAAAQRKAAYEASKNAKAAKNMGK